MSFPGLIGCTTKATTYWGYTWLTNWTVRQYSTQS